jgi:hypothetical protein
MSDVITHYIIELNNIDIGENAVAASGVFLNELPSELSILVQDETNYRLDVKAIRKGTGYGIGIDFGSNPPRMFHNSLDITNELDYNPEHNIDVNSNNHIKTYITSDSSQLAYQYNPVLDLYFKGQEFNSGSISSLTIDLDRVIFGVEIIVNNFIEGNIEFELNPGISSLTRININAGQDSTFHTVIFSDAIRTSQTFPTAINFVLNDVSTPLFSESLDYNLRKIKRFEINLSESSQSEKSTTINVVELPLVRGDTIQVSG